MRPFSPSVEFMQGGDLQFQQALDIARSAKQQYLNGDQPFTKSAEILEQVYDRLNIPKNERNLLTTNILGKNTDTVGGYLSQSLTDIGNVFSSPVTLGKEYFGKKFQETGRPDLTPDQQRLFAPRTGVSPSGTPEIATGDTTRPRQSILENLPTPFGTPKKMVSDYEAIIDTIDQGIDSFLDASGIADATKTYVKPYLFEYGKSLLEGNKEAMKEVPVPRTFAGKAARASYDAMLQMVDGVVTGALAGGGTKLLGGSKKAVDAAARIVGTGTALTLSPFQLAAEANANLEAHPVWKKLTANMLDSEKKPLLELIQSANNDFVYDEKFLNGFQVAQAGGALPIGSFWTRVGVDVATEMVEESLDDTVIAGTVVNTVLQNYLKSTNNPLANDPTLVTNKTEWIKQNVDQVVEAAAIAPFASVGPSLATAGVESIVEQIGSARRDNPDQIQGYTNTILNKLKTLNKKDPEQVREYLNNPITEEVLRDIQAKSDAGQILSKEQTEVFKRHNEIDTPILDAPLEQRPLTATEDSLGSGTANMTEYYEQYLDDLTSNEKTPTDTVGAADYSKAKPPPDDSAILRESKKRKLRPGQALKKAQKKGFQTEEDRNVAETIEEFYKDLGAQTFPERFNEIGDLDSIESSPEKSEEIATDRAIRAEDQFRAAQEEQERRLNDQLSLLPKDSDLRKKLEDIKKQRRDAQKQTDAILKADEQIEQRDFNANQKQLRKEALAREALANQQRIVEIEDTMKGFEEAAQEAAASQSTLKEQDRVFEQDILTDLNQRIADQKETERALEQQTLEGMTESVEAAQAAGTQTPRQATRQAEAQAQADFEADQALTESDMRVQGAVQELLQEEQQQLEGETTSELEALDTIINLVRPQAEQISQVQDQAAISERVARIFPDIEESIPSEVANGLTVNPDTPRGAQILKQRELEVIKDAMTAEYPGVSNVQVVETEEEARAVTGMQVSQGTEGFAYTDQEGNSGIVLIGQNIEQKQAIEGQTGNILENAVRDGVKIYFHESLGHDGLKQLFGGNLDALNDMTARLYSARRDEINAWGTTRYTQSDWNAMPDSEKAEEWLVQNFVEEGIAPTGILDTFRMFFGKEFNDAAIRRQVNAIQDGLRKGNKPKVKLRGINVESGSPEGEEGLGVDLQGQQTQPEVTPSDTPSDTPSLGPIPRIPGVRPPTKTMLENARTRFGSSIPNERYRRLLESQYEGILQQLYDMTAAGRTPTAADKKQARLLLAELNAIQELLGSAPTETVAQTEAAPVQEPVQATAESTSEDVQPELTVPKLVTEGSVENVNVGDTIVVDGEEQTVKEVRDNQGMLFPVIEQNGKDRAVIPESAGLTQISPAVRMSAARKQKLVAELPISNILSGQEDLGTQPGDFYRKLGLPVRTKKDGTVKPTVSDVGRSLEQRYKRITENVPFKDSPEERDTIAEALNAEIEYQLQQDNSGVGWYDTTVAKALNRYAIMHPELASDADAQKVFKAILAVTSQGETVPKNGDYAHLLYSEYKDTGRLPTKFTGGKEGAIVLNNLQFLQKLIDKYGIADANAMLLEKMTVRDINKFSEPFGKSGVGGERLGTELLGAAAFGPKIGIFFSNLSGQYDFPTIDLWFQRTMGRMQGQIFGYKPNTDEKYRKILRDHWAKNPKNFTPSKTVKQIPQDDLTLNLWSKETLNEYAKPVPTGEFKPDGTRVMRSYPEEKKTLETNAAKNIINNLVGLKGAPTSADRILTRDVLQRIQAKRAENNQEPLTIPDMQAVLWYVEKDLYTGQGAGNVTAEKADYADAAEQVVETYGNKEQKRQLQRARASGDVRSRDQSAGSPNTGTDPVIRRESRRVGQATETGPIQTTDRRASSTAGYGDRGRRDSTRTTKALEGAPITKGPDGTRVQGPIPELVEVAEAYAAANGIDYKRQGQYVEVDEDLATRIANAYDAMEHAPNDPAVKEAYRDLIDQTRAQYDALVDAGFEFTFYDGDTDPYDARPFRAMNDLRFNKKMAVFGTYGGYGTEGITRGDLENNPMLEDTGLQWVDQNGEMRPVLANDLFRAVHDAFGHGLEGAGFRARGEENAWQAHARLFTGPALGAITSETRGQNSWLNYGPYGESNRNASLFDTVFADQKTGLMPEFTWQEGKSPDMVDDTQEDSISEGANLLGTRFSSARRPLQNNPQGQSRDQQAARGAFNALATYFDTKRNLPEQEFFEELKQTARGQMSAYVEAGRDLGTLFIKAKPVEQSLIYNYLTDPNGDATSIPDRQVRGLVRRGARKLMNQPNPTLRQAAIEAKQRIEKIGEDLVRLGMLDPQVFENRKGQYLPRIYLKHLFNEGHQKILSSGGSLKMSDLGYLKKMKDIDALVRESVLGEIKSPGYLVSKVLMQSGQDIARMDFLKAIARNQTWVLPESYVEVSYANEIENILNADPALRRQLLNEGLPPAARQTAVRRVTPEYLDSEVRRLRDAVIPYRSGASKTLTERLAGVLAQKVSDARTTQDYDSLNYTKMPDTSRYGDLRGAIVRNEVYDEFVGSPFGNNTTKVEEAIGVITSLMKFNLTAANPVVWANNLRSNTAMMHFAGLPVHRNPWYRLRALYQMATNGARYRAFKDQGLVLSTFASNELGKIETALARNLSAADKKILGRPFKYSTPALMARNLWAFIYNKLGGLYQGMEVMDKLALGMYLEEHGPSLGVPFANNRKMSTAAAMREANKWLFDYSDVPDSIRRGRKSLLGAPFITWAYKATPQLLGMVKSPKGWIRAASWYGLMYMVMASQEADLSDEEYNAYYASLPDWLAQRDTFSVPLPMLDENGMTQTSDFTMFSPHALLANVGTTAVLDAAGLVLPDEALPERATRFNLVDEAKALGFASHPLLESTMELVYNKDSFTGKPIYRDTDTTGQFNQKMVEHFGNNLLPQLVAPNGFMRYLIELSADDPNVFGPSKVLDREGNPRRTLGQQVARVNPLVPNRYPTDSRSSLGYRRQEILDAIRAQAKKHSANRRKYKGNREALRELEVEHKAEMDRLRARLRAFPRAGDLPRLEETAE